MSINRPRQNVFICSDNSVWEVKTSCDWSETPSGVFDFVIQTSLFDNLDGFNLLLNLFCIVMSKLTALYLERRKAALLIVECRFKGSNFVPSSSVCWNNVPNSISQFFLGRILPFSKMFVSRLRQETLTDLTHFFHVFFS